MEGGQGQQEDPGQKGGLPRAVGLGTSTGQGVGVPGSILSGHRPLLSTTWSLTRDSWGASSRVWQAPMLGCPTRNLRFPFSLSPQII